MKTLKMAQNAANEMLANACIFGAVQISNDFSLIAGRLILQAYTLNPLDNGVEKTFDLDPMDVYLYSVNNTPLLLDENSLTDLNLIIDIADCEEYEEMSEADNAVMFSDLLASTAPFERDDAVSERVNKDALSLVMGGSKL